VRRGWLALAFVPLACLFPSVGDLQSDGGELDAAVEAQPDAPDEPPAADAGAEADADAGFCESLGGGHAFCEDFDHGVFSAQFDKIVTTQGVSLGSDGAEFTSPPLSLLAIFPAKTGKSDQAYMTRAFATATSGTFALDVRFDAWTPGSSGVFAEMRIDDNLPTEHTLEAYATDTYAALEENFAAADGGQAFVDHTFSTPIPLGAWRRVSFSLDVSSHTCSASLDGVTVFSGSLDPSWAAGPIQIHAGLTYVGAETNGWQARYDDLVFDFQ